VGLTGLEKKDRRRSASREALRALEKGTAFKEQKQRNVTHIRVNFSLTAEVSADIDALSLVPKTFRTSRSDVVKAGIIALKTMPKDELVALLDRVANQAGATEVK